MSSTVSPRLSPREKQVLRDYTKGFTEKEIAFHLGISLSTVKTYGYNIRTKLHAEDKAHAVAIALQSNILT